MPKNAESLKRGMGLLGLTATGICSMLGASVFIVPFMIQRNVPGIGPYVVPAFLLAAVPAVLAAMAYSVLSSAMPRAGGSYIYASRGLSPYLGFVASFSQWFGLSIVIGVVSYVMIPFMRDAVEAIGWFRVAQSLEMGWVRVTLALIFLWTFVLVNIRGTRSYEKTVVPLMFVMFLLGSIVIIAGFSLSHTDFYAAYEFRTGEAFYTEPSTPISFATFLTAAAVLFSSFIGFDSVAQAGGEAKNPGRNLPMAIGLTIGIVGLYYIVFTSAVYHALPWTYVAKEALTHDVTAPGLLSYMIDPIWAVPIIAGAAVALVNDLPAMLLSVSRLMFAWSKDGIFPSLLSSVHATYQTPHVAIVASGITASIGIFGCHFAGDFFLGVDIMVTSMMVNFILMCLTLVTLPMVNKDIYRDIQVIKQRGSQVTIGICGILVLTFFLSFHIYKDFSVNVSAWYYRSTIIYLLVMGVASLVYFNNRRKIENADVIFSKLPEE